MKIYLIILLACFGLVACQSDHDVSKEGTMITNSTNTHRITIKNVTIEATVDIPAALKGHYTLYGGYLIFAHPRVSNPVTDVQYGFVLDFKRLSERAKKHRATRTKEEKEKTDDFNNWQMDMHKVVSVRRFGDFVYIQRDIETETGDVFSIRGRAHAGKDEELYVSQMRDIVESFCPLNPQPPYVGRPKEVTH